MNPDKLGEMFLKGGLITAEQLRSALDNQKRTKERLGSILVKEGMVKDEDLIAFLGRQFGMPVVDLRAMEVQTEVARLLPEEFVLKNLAIPVNRVGTKLLVALADPTAMNSVWEMLTANTGYQVELVLASEKAIVETVNKHFGQAMGSMDLNLEEEIGDVEVVQEQADLDALDAVKGAEDAPIVKFANDLLMMAAKQRASDIHIEPYEKEFRIRFRVDGVLKEVVRPPMRVRNALSSRIKIMSNLDIAERRLPQDGRIKLKMGKNQEMDFRVSVLPTIFGEKIVLRLLDKSNLQLDMTKLGFETEPLNDFLEAIHRPYGMVLVTGPTGSGKTTTLYSALADLNKISENISTAEDPVEFNFAGINQVLIREDIGLTFAAALRSFLRQDPDIIMVGEIRDYETAEIGVKAALTGHLVLSTLHTNDAPGTVVRLINMGIEPFLVASSLNLILAQRLARKVCRNCAEEIQIPPKALLEAGMRPERIPQVKALRGKGCSDCNKGYKGRLALYEVMPIKEDLKKVILQGGSAMEIKAEAMRLGMKTLRQAGLQKVEEGITTLEEVIRVTAAD
jgi:type IV pilus assembly protein PilB